MKKLLALGGLLVLVFVLLLAGCGKRETPVESGQSINEQPIPETSAPAVSSLAEENATEICLSRVDRNSALNALRRVYKFDVGLIGAWFIDENYGLVQLMKGSGFADGEWSSDLPPGIWGPYSKLYHLTLTNRGEEYLWQLRENCSWKKGGSYLLKIAEVHIERVTDIVDASFFTEAKAVVFQYRLELTPMGRCLIEEGEFVRIDPGLGLTLEGTKLSNVLGKTQEGDAVFVKHDDGWRLAEGELSPGEWLYEHSGKLTTTEVTVPDTTPGSVRKETEEKEEPPERDTVKVDLQHSASEPIVTRDQIHADDVQLPGVPEAASPNVHGEEAPPVKSTLRANIILDDRSWARPGYDAARTHRYPFPSRGPFAINRFTEWWSDTYGTEVLTADINGDGNLEVITSDGSSLKAFSGNGNLLWSTAASGSLNLISDVTGDGVVDIVLSRRSGNRLQLLIYDNQGRYLKTLSRAGGDDARLSARAAADFDGDGAIDILTDMGAGYSLKPRGVSLFDCASGYERWHYAAGSCSCGFRMRTQDYCDNSAIGDINEDGLIEVVLDTGSSHNGGSGCGVNGQGTCTNDSQTYTIAFSTTDGREIFTYEYPASAYWNQGEVESVKHRHGHGIVQHAIVDLDHDGNSNILAFEGHDPVFYPGLEKVHFLNETGQILNTWNGPLNKHIMNWCICDINSDGYDEIVLVDGQMEYSGWMGKQWLNVSLRILNHNLKEIATLSELISTMPAQDFIDIVANDINGDGKPDLLLCSPQMARLAILDASLNEIWSYSAPGLRTVALSDLDGDGVNEIILSGSAIHVLRASSPQEASKQLLIEGLEDLKDTIVEKIDHDIENVAIAFTDVKDYWRTKRWADIFRVPLRLIEGTLSLLSTAYDLVTLSAGSQMAIGTAESTGQILSVFATLNGAWEAGGKLQLALDGPSYSAALEEMLEDADGTIVEPFGFDRGYYRRTILNHLWGVDGQSPLVVVERAPSIQREGLSVVNGAYAVRSEIQETIDQLVAEIVQQGIPDDFPLEECIAQLEDLTSQIMLSKSRSIESIDYDAYLATASSYSRHEVSTSLGAIGALYAVFGHLAGVLDEVLRIETTTEVVKAATAAGNAALLYSGTYSIEGVAEGIKVFTRTAAPTAIVVDLCKVLGYGNPEEAYYSIPQEMMLVLPIELANLWVLVNDVETSIRYLAGLPLEQEPLNEAPEDSESRGWTMFKGDPTHCGIVDGNYQGKSLSLAWATRLGYAHTYYNSQPVCNTESVFVAAYGYVDSPYVGTDDNALYALDMEDGSQRWRVVMPDKIVSIALAGSTVLASCRDGFLYAYDASSGEFKWQAQVMPSAFSEITVQGNTDVFVSSSDGAVLRIRAGNGEIVWKSQLTDDTTLTSAPTVIHDAVYVSDFNGGVYRLRLSDGSQVWETRLPGWSRGSLAVEGSVLFCGTRAGEWKDGSGKLFALSVEDGAILWSRATLNEIWSSISVGDGVVYFGADRLYAAKVSTGSILWEAPIACWRQPPVITGDSVMVVDLDNQRLVGLEKTTGDIIFEFGGTFRGDHSQVPLVVGDRVYIALKSGYVVGLNFIQGSQADEHTKPDNEAEGTGASFIVQPGEEIQSIVDIAPEGATITLSPGKYAGPIRIRNSIDLVGAGSPDGVVITGGNGGQPVVEIGNLGQAPKVLIRNMTIQNESKNVCCGLRVQGDSAVALDNICVQIDGAAGILALDSAHLTITNSEINDCNTIGILADLKARVQLIATTVSRTDGTGVMCSDQANILMEDANIVDSRGLGVAVSARGNVQLNRVSIAHNTLGGIFLQNRAEAYIVHSKIVENGCDGIFLSGSAELELESCSVMRNSGFGVLVCMQSCPPTAFPDSYWQEREFSGSVKGSGNNIPPIGEDDENSLGALCPRLSAPLWPDKFIGGAQTAILDRVTGCEVPSRLARLGEDDVVRYLAAHPITSRVWKRFDCS